YFVQLRIAKVNLVTGTQDSSTFMLLDVERQELFTRFAIGRDRESMLGYRVPGTQGLFGHVFRQGEPVTVCDIAVDGRLTLPFPATSVLCVPLIADTKLVGMLIATDKLSGVEFWSQELQLMGIFASEVSSALQKANLYEEINKLFLSTVEALATSIDAKDPYTYGHSRRVAELAVAIGQRRFGSAEGPDPEAGTRFAAP
ncbi:MAG: GAF domain-containing protein, partial [Desulfomicrobium escambiense]|nr:GAF domain-containing protein [Desulfomicrobium escambiense]